MEENISKAEQLPLDTEVAPVVIQFQQLSQSWFWFIYLFFKCHASCTCWVPDHHKVKRTCQYRPTSCTGSRQSSWTSYCSPIFRASSPLNIHHLLQCNKIISLCGGAVPLIPTFYRCGTEAHKENPTLTNSHLIVLKSGAQSSLQLVPSTARGHFNPPKTCTSFWNN